MSFLNLEDKCFIIFGLANKKSVACAIAKVLVGEKAKVIHVVRTEERRKNALKLFPDNPVYVCDVEDEENIVRVRDEIKGAGHDRIDGIVHSIAFANYSEGLKPFYGTLKKDFLQAMDISCFSFIAIANHFKEMLDKNASVLTISISTTRMAAENYGYMAPVKAALESSLCFLTKSFSQFSRVRFNALCPGLLKTSASAGIPGYVESYLFAEKAIPRKKGVKTSEVADAAAFILSERSSGIASQCLVIDAAMGTNYFDSEIIAKVNAP